MIINVVSFDPEQTGMTEEELGAVQELCGNELLQKFFKAQKTAVLKWAAAEADPFNTQVTDAAFRTGMQRIHAIASLWGQIAEQTARIAD